MKEHLWKSGKKRQHGKRIGMMGLGTIAENAGSAAPR
jgi:hypothetical protein